MAPKAGDDDEQQQGDTDGRTMKLLVKVPNQPEKDFYITTKLQNTMSEVATVISTHIGDHGVDFTKKFTIMLQGKNVYPVEQFRSLSEYSDMLRASNQTVYLGAKLAGGGPKRGRSTGVDTTIPTVYVAPTSKGDDISVVSNALKITAVCIPDWLDTMTTGRLYSLHEAYDTALKASAHTDRHVNLMMEYVNEYKALEATRVCSLVVVHLAVLGMKSCGPPHEIMRPSA